MVFRGTKVGGLVELGDSFLGDFRDFRKYYKILRIFLWIYFLGVDYLVYYVVDF